MKRGKLLTLSAWLLLALGRLAWAGGTAEHSLITPADARDLLAAEAQTVLLDVRTAEEFAEAHIPGAKLLPYDGITAQTAAGMIPSKSTPVIVYCRSGRRSDIAAVSLAKLGYTRVYDLGAISYWKFGLTSGAR